KSLPTKGSKHENQTRKIHAAFRGGGTRRADVVGAVYCARSPGRSDHHSTAGRGAVVAASGLSFSGKRRSHLPRLRSRDLPASRAPTQRRSKRLADFAR